MTKLEEKLIELGYRIIKLKYGKVNVIILRKDGKPDLEIKIYLEGKIYSSIGAIDMQEHKLLHELFTIWGWI